MDGGTIIGILILAVVLMVIILIYGMYGSAISAARRSQEYKVQVERLVVEFHRQDKQLRQLKYLVNSKSREYLYTDIDDRIKSAFNHANEEIRRGLSQNRDIESISSPEFSMKDMFDFQANRNKHHAGRRNREKYEILECHCEKSQDWIEIIQEAVREEQRINSRVERKLKEYKGKIGQREGKLTQAKIKPESEEYKRLHSLLILAQQQAGDSLKILSLPTQETGFYYARGLVMLLGLEQAISLWDLEWDIENIPFNYELDISNRDVKNMKTKVAESIFSMPMTDFDALRLKAVGFEELKKDIAGINSIFDAFKGNRSAFEEKRRKVCESNLGDFAQRAHKAEKEWSEYWDGPFESPARWYPHLQKEGLPSKRLKDMSNAIKRMCTSEILDIKQSELPIAINELSSILGDFDRIKTVIVSLEKAVKEHSLAKSQVEEKIERYGPTEIVYESLNTLKDEKRCSPNIEGKIQSLESQYMHLCDRAKVKKNADYPYILNELKALESLAAVIKKEHEKEIAEKRKRIDELKMHADKLKLKFQNVKKQFPTENLNWDQIATEFDEIRGDFLRALGYYPKMDKFERIANRKIAGLKEEYSRIKSEIQRLASEIKSLKDKIQVDKVESEQKAWSILKTKWRGPLLSKLDEIRVDIRAYDGLLKEAETISEKSLKDMRSAIRSVTNGLYGLNRDISSKIQSATHFEMELSEAKDVLESALRRAVEGGLSDTKQKEVLDFIENAKSPEHAPSIPIALDILKRDAMQVLGRPSVEFINRKTEIHGGVNTQGGLFLTGDVDIKGGDLVGRDKKTSGDQK
jgi:hypothetical protein